MERMGDGIARMPGDVTARIADKQWQQLGRCHIRARDPDEAGFLACDGAHNGR